MIIKVYLFKINIKNQTLNVIVKHIVYIMISQKHKQCSIACSQHPYL